MASNTLHWTNSTRKLSELVPQPDNPRQIDAVQAQRLVESYKEFSQTDMLLIGPDNELYNGHQRVNEWAAAFGLDLEVEVRVASRPLARAEWQKLTVLSHRGAVGQWDMGVLEEWDIDESLVEWGFEAHELEWDMINDAPPSLADLEKEYGEPDARDFWPYIKVQVSPETHELWESLMAETGIEDEALAMEKILSCVRIEDF